MAVNRQMLIVRDFLILNRDIFLEISEEPPSIVIGSFNRLSNVFLMKIDGTLSSFREEEKCEPEESPPGSGFNIKLLSEKRSATHDFLRTRRSEL
jgi:hypothetical protein